MDKDRIAGEAGRVGGKVKEKVGTVVSDESLEADGLIDQASGAVQNAYGQVKDAARDAAGRAASEGRRYVEAGRDYVDRGLDNLPDAPRAIYDGRETLVRYVRETPVASLLIAGAIGYGVALLLHRSSEPEPPAPPSRRRRRTAE